MSEEIRCTMPAIYPKVAELLARPCDRLQDALCEHRQPIGDPYTLEELTRVSGDLFQDHISRLVVTIGRLGKEVMNPELEVPEEEAVLVVAELDDQLAGYINHVQAMLSRPWPEGMAEGRILLAAVLERPLRDLLGFFEKIRGLIHDPALAAASRDSGIINLQLVLAADAEIQAFVSWLDRVGGEAKTADRCRSGGLLAMLAGLSLGYWWGKK